MGKRYTVKKLGELSGVSIRTLHHYDEIGLLSPKYRTDSGYRVYGKKEVLRLQQILFYRELDVPLREIYRILDDPDFSEKNALLAHRKALLLKKKRLDRLIVTIDRTLQRLEEETMVTDKELYEGFAKEQIERYEREIEENYDPKLVAESKERIKRMSKKDWELVKAEGEAINKSLAELLEAGESPNSKDVQEIIGRHHQWVENFYTISKDVYLGLGKLYTTHGEFRDYYERYAVGLADFLCRSIEEYVARWPSHEKK